MIRILPPLVMALFGALILFLIPVQINETNNEGLGPRFFPSLIGWGIILFSLASVISNFGKIKKDKEEKEENPRFEVTNLIKVVVIFVCILFWIVIIPYAGFIITTTLMTFVVTTTLGNHHKGKAILFSIILSAVLYFIFAYLLNINLPEIF